MINKPSQPTYRRRPPLLEPDFLRGANVEAGVVGAKNIRARKVKIVSIKYEEVETVLLKALDQPLLKLTCTK